MNRPRPSTILRGTIYLHVLAILMCVGVILMELAYRDSDTEPPLTLNIRFLINLLSLFALLVLAACPVASLLICGFYVRSLTRREIWIALTKTVGLTWFQVVWILGPCVGDASCAKQRQMRKMEIRNMQRETGNT